MNDSIKDMFNVVDIYSLMLTVNHPNGTLAKISTIGSLRLSSGIVLFDVLVVPEYNVSLLYVSNMIKDSKFFVGLDKHKCYIQDLNQGKIMGTGSESVLVCAHVIRIFIRLGIREPTGSHTLIHIDITLLGEGKKKDQKCQD
ncbi:hypothetical protein Tco_0189075 [Tanacetum coccineum]